MSRESKGSRQQEEAAAERDGGRRVARSGAGILKGDVEIQSKKRIVWMRECKRTWKDWIAVKWNWWSTVCEHAVRENKDPMLELEFGKHILVGFERCKIDELMSLSKLEKPIKISTMHFSSRKNSTQLTLHLYEVDAFISRAAELDSVAILHLEFAFTDQDRHLCFVQGAFATKLLESVYG